MQRRRRNHRKRRGTTMMTLKQPLDQYKDKNEQVYHIEVRRDEFTKQDIISIEQDQYEKDHPLLGVIDYI